MCIFYYSLTSVFGILGGFTVVLLPSSAVLPLAYDNRVAVGVSLVELGFFIVRAT